MLFNGETRGGDCRFGVCRRRRRTYFPNRCRFQSGGERRRHVSREAFRQRRDARPQQRVQLGFGVEHVLDDAREEGAGAAEEVGGVEDAALGDGGVCGCGIGGVGECEVGVGRADKLDVVRDDLLLEDEELLEEEELRVGGGGRWCVL